MNYFDTHCHLNLTEFDGKLHETVISAREKGVSEILIPGTNVANSLKAVEIAENYKTLYAAVGIHPTEPLETYDPKNELFKMEEILNLGKKQIRAVGEVGLDFYRFTAPPRIQIEYLQAQINLAKKYSLAISIHNRLAAEALIDLLKIEWSESLSGRIVFHCCEANQDLLKFAIDRFIYIGVDGDYTYDKDKKNFAKEIPVELLVLETDSPYMTPEPLRSEKVFPNTPKNLTLTADALSRLKNISHESLAKTTTDNARRLFA